MHELSIAQSVVETVEKELENQPGALLRKVGLRIGELSGVDADSLRFSWECLTRETGFEGVALAIETRAWQRRCPPCELIFAVSDFQTICPQCGTRETEHAGGDELDVAYLELETP